MSSKRNIAVVGSLNIDHAFKVDRLPLPGQTVASSGAVTAYGGKGANQAMAIQKAGGNASLISCVGDDREGRHYLEYLRLAGISTDAVSIVSNKPIPTGSAFIAVNSEGENTIIVNAGANNELSPEHIDLHESLILDCATLLFQLECPIRTVKQAAAIARTHNVQIVANPSPWIDDFLTEQIPCDHIILNELEASAFTGVDPFDPSLCTDQLIETMGLETIVVTRGSRPTFLRSKAGDTLEVLPPKVTPIDTVGAGDAFAGAFTLAITEGKGYRDALTFANAAGALATQKIGAQNALPERHRIEELVAKTGE